jgi:hypothetical protein
MVRPCGIGTGHCWVFAGTMSREQAKLAAADPAVEFVTQNQVVEPGINRASQHPVTEDPVTDDEVGTDTDQADPVWNLDRVDQRNEVLDVVYNYTTSASTVRAYILDSGMRFTHAQFGGRAVSGFDAIDGGPANDCSGYGTQAAGIVGSSHYGVAKRVQLVAVRIVEWVSLDDDHCREFLSGDAEMVAGIEWVTANAVRPAVASMYFLRAAAISPSTGRSSGLSRRHPICPSGRRRRRRRV